MRVRPPPPLQHPPILSNPPPVSICRLCPSSNTDGVHPPFMIPTIQPSQRLHSVCSTLPQWPSARSPRCHRPVAPWRCRVAPWRCRVAMPHVYLWRPLYLSGARVLSRRVEMVSRGPPRWHQRRSAGYAIWRGPRARKCRPPTSILPSPPTRVMSVTVSSRSPDSPGRSLCLSLWGASLLGGMGCNFCRLWNI